jgi:predicted DNA-binding transcriptional regulator AlpA
MHAEMTEPLMTVAEVARMLSMSEAWVRQHSSGLRQPTIPSVKMGDKSVRFRRPRVLEFVALNERVV